MMQIFPYEMAAHLRVNGEDASDFLQSQFSNDLRPFEPGQATYGLWLDAKGKVVADSWVRCEGPERFRIFSEHCSSAVIVEKLERHIIADDVEIEILPPAAVVAVVGQEDLPLAGDWNAAVSLPGHRATEPSREYVFDTVEARDAFVRMNEAEVVSEHQIQQLRLKAGVPMVPAEIGPGELPGEGGLDVDAVAYDKGCFLGQEVVARMRNLGKATRGLYRVGGGGRVPECPQALLGDEGKVVGELRTAYPDGDSWIGVALLKIRHAASSLQLKGQVGAIQVESEFC
jgi:folate-binding protein YgfZ